MCSNTYFMKVSPNSFKDRIVQAIEIMEKYYVFIVSQGELESWIDDKDVDLSKIQNLINEIEEEDQKSKKVELKAFLSRIIEFYKQGI
jgi:hypothetical protein